ncbi:LysR family transcriptional regulator [Paenibacillus psychroresistens]|uniref:LysR family transcriptional regulator n=1 Tax=Paenibacillus psychroresistens TaxID=1778678 RepID=A0A6B8RH18_9BACL|nr:LysR family transcriptional regulator [Paenibacillus psychroresistens]QGQ94823.1 LysR family transcriptional regulator [Paenibacillus psychroresistens]
MNIHALRIFHHAAKHGSVTSAAKALYISQPAVTIQIKKLEAELNLPLFYLKARRIQLTAAGEMLFTQTKRLFSLEHEIESYIDEYRNGKQGKLRIVATYLPANILLPQWVAEFKRSNENVEIIMTTANSRSAFDQLLNYQAEVAVVGGGWEEAGIEWHYLFEDELWFIAPKDHKFANQEVSLSQIMKEPFIMREEGSSTRDRLFALCKTFNVSQPKVGLQFTGLNETIRAVIGGYGINLISALAVKEYIVRNEVARVYVKDVLLRRPLAICTRKGEFLSPSAAMFVEMIKLNYKETI